MFQLRGNNEKSVLSEALAAEDPPKIAGCKPSRMGSYKGNNMLGQPSPRSYDIPAVTWQTSNERKDRVLDGFQIGLDSLYVGLRERNVRTVPRVVRFGL
jgi:hypothetical protein